MFRLLSMLLALSLLVGCGGTVGSLPADPDQLILYSIDGPSYYKSDGVLTPDQEKGALHNRYPVLGKVEITEPKQRREIISALKTAVETPSSRKACFIPRHAIRFIKGGKTIDLVICFQCSNYQIYRQGEYDSGGGIGDSVQPLFDEILRDAGVPLAAKD
jgi:hypothetical protein